MWAQDRNCVILTIKLQDVYDEKIEFLEDELRFAGKTRKPEVVYDMRLPLFGQISPSDEHTKYNVYGRNVFLTLKKKDPKIWWPRLAKTTQKLHNVKIDWERWIDDDDEAFEAPSIETKNIETSSDNSSSSESEKETIEESSPNKAQQEENDTKMEIVGENDAAQK